jgi:predicted RNase H-like HicB family nuclease
MHNIPDTINWKIELNRNGLVATSEELPGLVTNGKNPEELLEMINDAVLEYFDVSKMDSDYVFDQLNLHGQGSVMLKQAKKKRQYA